MSRIVTVATVTALLAVACGGSDEASIPETGVGIYRAVCQTCHGPQGAGFVGPSLLDVAERYPDVADEIALVTNGTAEMPGFAERLTARQIATVVEYTRTTFSSHPSTTAGPTLPDAAG